MRRLEILWVRDESVLLKKRLLLMVRVNDSRERYVRIKENRKTIADKYSRVTNGERVDILKDSKERHLFSVQKVDDGYTVWDCRNGEEYKLKGNDSMSCIEQLIEYEENI